MKKECKLVQDLLPNYIENLTSDETNKIIEEHLKDCKECQNVLSTMKEKITTNTEHIEKKKINYLKKYNREVRVLQIMLLIILIGFIVHAGGKYAVLASLHQKFNNTVQNLNNYYMRVVTMSNYDVTQDSEQMYIRETYYKDGKFISIQKHITDIKKFYLIAYKNGNDKRGIYIETEDGKTKMQDIDYGENIDGYALKPGESYWKNNFFKDLYTALFEKIERVNINGKDCYVIGSRYGGTEYVDATTGTSIKFVNLDTNLIMSEYLEIGNVKDSDIAITKYIEE